MPKLSLPWRIMLRTGLSAILLALFSAACKGRLAAQVVPTIQATMSKPAPSETPAPTPPPLAAVVNGEWILQAEVDAGVKQVQAAREALLEAVPECLLQDLIPGDPAAQEKLVLDRLIAETLLAQAAHEAGFAPSESELLRRRDDLVRAAGDLSAFSSWLDKYGYTQDALLDALHRSIAAAWQRDRIFAAVPSTAEQARARELLFTDPSLAAETLARLRSGEVDFTTLAYQRDPIKGGDLGWFPPGYLTQAAFGAVLFSLPPGETSEVIETPLGYHILQITGHEVDRPLTPETFHSALHRALNDWLAQQWAAGQIEVSLSIDSGGTPAPNSAGLPQYIVREGESLDWIAAQFDLSLQELLLVNPQVNPNMLVADTRLNIPGHGRCPIQVQLSHVQQGDHLEALAHQQLLAPSTLAELNRWTSPAEAYAGAPFVFPQISLTIPVKPLQSLAPGESVLELAARLGQNPWMVLAANQDCAPDNPFTTLLPGENLIGLGSGASAPVDVHPVIAGFEVDPLVQGGTARVRVQTRLAARISGRLDGHDLHFFPDGENGYVALQGIHAMSEPGLADFSLFADAGNGRVESFDQSLLLSAGGFAYDPPLTVAPETIDPALTVPEEELVRSITAPFTEEKYWEGNFAIPVEYWNCAPSGFGSRRSYNGSDYVYFHSGLDYGLCDNPHIFAPAAGIVAYTGALTVRGNATIIDHGRGVYSGIWHQSEIYVEVGERVEAGQLIGKIGATGRVTGEHLHWEVWVGGVQVSPAGWLNAGW